MVLIITVCGRDYKGKYISPYTNQFRYSNNTSLWFLSPTSLSAHSNALSSNSPSCGHGCRSNVSMRSCQLTAKSALTNLHSLSWRAMSCVLKSCICSIAAGCSGLNCQSLSPMTISIRLRQCSSPQSLRSFLSFLVLFAAFASRISHGLWWNSIYHAIVSISFFGKHSCLKSFFIKRVLMIGCAS